MEYKLEFDSLISLQPIQKGDKMNFNSLKAFQEKSLNLALSETEKAETVDELNSIRKRMNEVLEDTCSSEYPELSDESTYNDMLVHRWM